MKSPLKSVDCELITINFDQSTPSTWHTIIQLEMIATAHSLYGLRSNFRPGCKLDMAGEMLAQFRSNFYYTVLFISQKNWVITIKIVKYIEIADAF